MTVGDLLKIYDSNEIDIATEDYYGDEEVIYHSDVLCNDIGVPTHILNMKIKRIYAKEWKICVMVEE